LLAGPGVACPKNRCWGCEPVALESESFALLPSRARPFGLIEGVIEHLSVDDGGQPAFQAAHGFHRALAEGLFAVVVVRPGAGVRAGRWP
jgi:hypothetical protein